MPIRKSLPLMCALLTTIPVLLACWLLGTTAYLSAKDALENQVAQQLTERRDTMHETVQSYFKDIEKKITAFAADRMIIDATAAFREGFSNYPVKDSASVRTELNHFYNADFLPKVELEDNAQPLDARQFLNAMSPKTQALQQQYISGNPYPLGQKEKLAHTDDNSAYAQTHSRYHESITTFQRTFEFTDIFIINDQTGDIIYSVFKETDFATSLISGPYANSGLSQVYRAALNNPQGQATLVDFAPYTASYNAPASFIATPIFDGGTRIGVLAIQMPLAQINNLLTFDRQWVERGMGHSAQLYLVGQDGALRSDMREIVEKPQKFIENLRAQGTLSSSDIKIIAAHQSAVGRLVPSSPALTAAHSGTGYLEYQDAYGDTILSAYKPIDILNLEWYLVSEVHADEVLQARSVLRDQIIFYGLLIALIAIISGVITGVRLASKIVAPIISIAGTIKEIAQSNNFSIRCDVKTDNEIGIASNALNTMCEHLQSTINETQKVVSKLSVGEFGHRIDVECKGDLHTLKDSINACAERLQTSFGIIQTNLNYLAEGDFSPHTRAPLVGRYETLVSGAEGAIITIGSAIEAVAKAANSMAAGDFSVRINDELPGQLDELKRSLNASFNTAEHAISAFVEVSRSQADGDLTQGIDASYAGQFEELRNSFNAAQEAIRELIQDARSTADSVSQSCESVAVSNSNLGKRMHNNLSALSEASMSVSQIVDNIKDNAASAKSADSLTHQARKATDKGRVVMRSAIEAMGKIQTAGAEIGDIVETINGFAFQTNLLALNAAVEAARAGEHGKGFAVVASEVQSLAHKSAEAADNIKNLIDDSAQRIKEGTEQVIASGKSLDEINDGIAEITTLIGKISNQCTHQSSSIVQIQSMVGTVENTTRNNYSQIEETNNVVDAMHNNSDKLNNALSKFNT